MKMAYSIGAKFAGGGIGTTSYQGARGFWRHGHLSQLLVGSVEPTEISPEIITEFPYVKQISDKIFDLPMVWRWSRFQRVLNDNFFDVMASKKLKRCEAFYGWSNFCLRQIKKAKKMGAVTFLHRASTHQIFQLRIINEEHERLGLKKIEEPKKKMEWALEEYDIADYIVLGAEFSRQTFLEQGFGEDKLIVVPYGVELTRFERGAPAEDGIFRAVFVGSCQARKGIQYLVDAWRALNLPKAELIVCGEVVPEMKKILEEKSIDSIKWLGHVPVQEHLRTANVFVFPSLEEGSALCIYEAMACCLPVIVTPNSGSIARDGEDGFIVPARDVEKLQEKILYCYENREAARTMGRAARQQVEGFSWHQHGERLVEACLAKFTRQKSGGGK